MKQNDTAHNRLTAEPIQRIHDSGRSGWLYRWNNGDYQVFWDEALTRASPLLCCPLRCSEASPTTQ